MTNYWTPTVGPDNGYGMFWHSPVSSFDNMVDAGSAAAFGVGPAWIGGVPYWSDGTNWKVVYRTEFFDTLTEFNNAGGAASYGVGPVWIGGKLYWSTRSAINPIGGNNVLVSDTNITSSTPSYVNLESNPSPVTVSVYLPSGGGTSALAQFPTVPNAQSAAYTFNAPISGLKVTRVAGSGTVHLVARGS